MAYTYDDFVAAANKAGLLNQFSETDLVTAQKSPEYGLSLLSLKQDELNATTAEQKLLATEAANQLRQTYSSLPTGTSGSLDSQIQSIQNQIGSFGSFQYGNETAYRKALDAVANPEEFSYDMNTDPQYAALRQSMLRERDRAVADTLAKASAASGGVPSSYAVTAAQQAGDYYTGQLGDAGITLYQNALDKYMNEQNLNLSRLEALRGDRDDAYQVWLNKLGVLQTQLDQLQGQKEAQQAAAQTAYQQLLDALDGDDTENEKGAPTEEPTGPEVIPEQNVDTYSILALGYGPISEARLNQLIRQGLVEQYEENGVIKYRNKAASGGNAAGLPAINATAAGTSGTDANNAAGPVANTVDDSKGVKVEGTWLSWAELLDGVAKGTITETYDQKTGQYTYSYARSNAKNKGGSGQGNDVRLPTHLLN